jgi:hypothetical protein
VFKDVSLLAFRPLVSEGGKAFEILLFNHIWETSSVRYSTTYARFRPELPSSRLLFVMRIWICLKGVGTLESN